MITKYAIENKKKAADPKRQKTSGQEKLFYKAEEELLLRQSEASFSFKTIFRETLEDGTKKNIAGGGQGAPETQYKLVYLIKYSEYQKRVKEMQGFLKSMVEWDYNSLIKDAQKVRAASNMLFESVVDELQSQQI